LTPVIDAINAVNNTATIATLQKAIGQVPTKLTAVPDTHRHRGVNVPNEVVNGVTRYIRTCDICGQVL
jgi:hypothetical protein